MTRRAWVAFAVVTVFSLAVFAAEDGTRLLRYPDIHGDTVVFCYGGDLWSASAAVVRRPASPPTRARRSSPASRRTAGGSRSPVSTTVTSRSMSSPPPVASPNVSPGTPPRVRYRRVGATINRSTVGRRTATPCSSARSATPAAAPRAGSTRSRWRAVFPRPCPCPPRAPATSPPMARKMVYSPLFRDFRHWKRYQGGWAQDLFIFDLDISKSPPSPTATRTERDPMWIGDTVYFVSDRGDRLNLFKADPKTGESRATHQARSLGSSLAGHRQHEPHRLRTRRSAPDLRRRLRHRHGHHHQGPR